MMKNSKLQIIDSNTSKRVFAKINNIEKEIRQGRPSFGERKSTQDAIFHPKQTIQGEVNNVRKK